MTRNSKKSPFAAALQALLDDTGLFSRRDWARLLGIKESAISQWVNEETIPRATNLNMVYVTIEKASDADQGPRQTFFLMAQQPATEVSPKNGKRMLPTVWNYMKRPVFDELSSKLAKLTPAEQEKFLELEFSEKEIPLSASDISVLKATANDSIDFEDSDNSLEAAGDLELGECEHTWFSPSLAATYWSPLKDSAYITPTFLLHSRDITDEMEGALLKWEQVAEKSNKLLITGSPGAGKTHLIAHVVQALNQRENWAARPWPGRSAVCISMNRLPPVETSSELWSFVQSISPDAKENRLALFLDGLDEVQMERREGIVRAINGLEATRPAISLIVTSRPSPALKALTGLTHCSIQPASDSRLLALAYRKASSALLLESTSNWDESLLRIGLCFRERPDVFHAVANPLLLSFAANSFAKWEASAVRDTDVLDSCLRFLIEGWDLQKQIVRSRSKWTHTSANRLFHWLGALSYNSLVHNAPEFTRAQLESWSTDLLDEIPAERDLTAIAELTGVIAPSTNNYWRVVDRTMQEYLAARYVVESSFDATTYLKDPNKNTWTSNVLRFACSMTHDASPLLKFVLKSSWSSQIEKMAALAGMISQQIKASDDIIEESCEWLVSHLEDTFDGWQIVSEVSEVFPQPKWKLSAQRVYKGKTPNSQLEKQVLRTVKSVHRARYSPAREQLSNRLSHSKSEVIRGFGESLDVEGYMESRSFSRERNDLFAAEIYEI